MESFTAVVNVHCVYRLSCRIKFKYPNNHHLFAFLLSSLLLLFSIQFQYFFSMSSKKIKTKQMENGKKPNLKLNEVNCLFWQLIDWVWMEWKGDCSNVKINNCRIQWNSNQKKNSCSKLWLNSFVNRARTGKNVRKWAVHPIEPNLHNEFGRSDKVTWMSKKENCWIIPLDFKSSFVIVDFSCWFINQHRSIKFSSLNIYWFSTQTENITKIFQMIVTCLFFQNSWKTEFII